MSRRPSPQTAKVLQGFLVDPDTWRYGYDLSQQFSISSGTLYPILARLTDRDQLETRWVVSELDGRPPRHMYRLTSAGRVWARHTLKEALPVLRTVEGLA